MNHSENVDHDAVLQARTMLLGSDRPSLSQQVQAYRVLARVSPAAYLPKLAAALTSYGYDVARKGGPDLRLALHTEAAEAARRVDPEQPNRIETLLRALDSYQRTLLVVGRRAEAFAVCEEMAEAGRLDYEPGHVSCPTQGQDRLADMLTEEGRHGEAAGLRERGARPSRQRVWFGTTVAWTADLGAAGRHEEALTVFTALVDQTRSEAEAEAASLAELVWQLAYRSQLFEAAGDRGGAGTDRQEALRLLARLAEGGEPTNRYFGSLASWTALFALSGRADEPAASRQAPAPPFGIDSHHWSPDSKEAYLAEIPVLAEEVTELTDSGRLFEAVAAHHRLIRRSTVAREGHHYQFEERLRPLFDEGVALARRLPGAREAVARALTDRSLFLVAAHSYGEAHADFAEAVALLEGTTTPSIVTRT
ncbi:hypothetical protein [Streptomyces sp. NBC_00572]|uniref:hypothetical protein n=1 Tax=Streptomyces sp. NBC_00572 TaxID=2903664 RepID=UPI00224EAFF3|nr:hypothetical protein [Streptomyces sp. NBC_00572]MCX4984441.1 hypothetical protein [Streptomyces sp. NBC_00572]